MFKTVTTPPLLPPPQPRNTNLTRVIIKRPGRWHELLPGKTHQAAPAQTGPKNLLLHHKGRVRVLRRAACGGVRFCGDDSDDYASRGDGGGKEYWGVDWWGVRVWEGGEGKGLSIYMSPLPSAAYV